MIKVQQLVKVDSKHLIIEKTEKRNANQKGI